MARKTTQAARKMGRMALRAMGFVASLAKAILTDLDKGFTAAARHPEGLCANSGFHDRAGRRAPAGRRKQQPHNVHRRKFKSIRAARESN